MIERRHKKLIRRDLGEVPAVVLLGPRQVGKTTLARAIAGEDPDTLYVDLEDPTEASRFSEAREYLDLHRHRLVILDEVQRLPGLFRLLRGQIDARRRGGRRSGHFLLLGSASRASLRQSAESLAGRVAYRELPVLDPLETGSDLNRLWLRGGFPDSFTAGSDAASMGWRGNFIRTRLERDLPQSGLRATWEGFAVENLIGAAPSGTDAYFYRTRSGAEIDLLLLLPGEEPWAVEIKRTRSPRVPKRVPPVPGRSLLSYTGFHQFQLSLSRHSVPEPRPLPGERAKATRRITLSSPVPLLR